MKSRRIVILLGIVAVAAVGGAVALSAYKPEPADPAPRPVAIAAEPNPRPMPARLVRTPDTVDAAKPAVVAPHPPKMPKALASPGRTEVSLMKELRDLGMTQPELSLKLAREGDARFPSSSDAAERAWFTVRSLENLKRHEEARAEALLMVDRYPQAEWTNDVRRHVLVNPPSHPAERGHGKKYELE